MTTRRTETPLGFVLAFGVVSLLADLVYEGARSVSGPFLAELGASAAVVGVVTGGGEAVALVFRLVTGPLADRTHRRWPLSIAGYAITLVAVPLLAAAQALWQASALIVAERFGKAVRTPARDTMLADAGSSFGRGWAFAVHEALDQSGAVLGPLLVAATVALSGYRLGFAVLALPGLLALALLLRLRRAVPRPEVFRTGAGGGRDAPVRASLLGVQRVHGAVDGGVRDVRAARLSPGDAADRSRRPDPDRLRRGDGRRGHRRARIRACLRSLRPARAGGGAAAGSARARAAARGGRRLAGRRDVGTRARRARIDAARRGARSRRPGQPRCGLRHVHRRVWDRLASGRVLLGVVYEASVTGMVWLAVALQALALVVLLALVYSRS